MAKKDDPNKGKIERIDPETGEVTYIDPETVEDAEIVPESETVDVGQTEIVDHDFEDMPAPTEGLADPEHVHAYDAGELNPEIQKLEGQIRNFLLDRIKNNWKPWQQMTVDEQQQLVNAIEMQARDTIRGTVRAVNDYEWAHCTVVLGQVTLKGGDKGIEAKITCSNVDENRNFLGEHVDKHVLILSTDAETFFGARDKVKYDGRGSQMDLPLGGNVKDIEAGGFADETAAIQDPAPAEEGGEDQSPQGEELEDEHAQDDHPADSEELPAWDKEPWPDDEQLGEHTTEDAPNDDGDEPGAA